MVGEEFRRGPRSNAPGAEQNRHKSAVMCCRSPTTGQVDYGAEQRQANCGKNCGLRRELATLNPVPPLHATRRAVAPSQRVERGQGERTSIRLALSPLAPSPSDGEGARGRGRRREASQNQCERPQGEKDGHTRQVAKPPNS